MFAVIKLQVFTVAALSLIVLAIVDIQAACSLFLGGAAYTLPTLISALILSRTHQQPHKVATYFITAVSLKIILALLLIAASISIYSNLRPIPFIIGLLAASHLVFLYFLKVYRYGK